MASASDDTATRDLIHELAARGVDVGEHADWRELRPRVVRFVAHELLELINSDEEPDTERFKTVKWMGETIVLLDQIHGQIPGQAHETQQLAPEPLDKARPLPMAARASPFKDAAHPVADKLKRPDVLAGSVPPAPSQVSRSIRDPSVPGDQKTGEIPEDRPELKSRGPEGSADASSSDAQGSGTRPEPISHLPRRPYEEEMQKIPEPVTPLSAGPVPSEMLEEPAEPCRLLSAEFLRNEKWLDAHLAELTRTHPDQWVAIWEERVVAADADLDKVVECAEAEYPDAEPVYWLVEGTARVYAR